MKKLFLFSAALFLSANIFALKILIVDNAKKQTIDAAGPFTLTVSNTGKKYKLKDGGKFTVTQLKNGKIKAGSVTADGEIILKPSANTPLNIAGNAYTGNIIIEPADKGFKIIEDTDIENYLYGVLPYEMHYTWPAEALKAQAVAARTYTLRTAQNPKNADFDLYCDVRDQMYKGSAIVYPPVKEAVDATRGEVLKYDDKLFFAYYHANSGGHTDSLPWQSPDGNIKPLQGAAKCYDEGGAGAKWSHTFTSAEIAAAAGIKGKADAMSITKRASSGRATQLKISTKDGGKRMTCNDFRIAIGSSKLKSCMITKIKKTKHGFLFEGKGYSHGSGMSQEGAKAMAEHGKNYKEILETFYPGSKLSKL